MTLHLYFSNQLSALAERLHAHLAEDDRSGSALSPSRVIVPTMNLSTWVKLFLARRAGIFMNVKFSYLEDGLWRMLRAFFPDVMPHAQPMDSTRFRLILFFILMRRESDPDMPEILRHYLDRPGGIEPDEIKTGEAETGVAELRAWQLAGTFSRLFQEYEYHRMDMIRRWRETETYSADPVEAGQRWLYQEAVRLSAAMGQRSGVFRISLSDYAALLSETGFKPATDPLFSTVHFFGLSQISPLHARFMEKLGSVCDLHVYSLNPSREYWEDIRTPAEKKWQRHRGNSTLIPDAAEWEAGELFSETDHPLLSAWGKPGRESIRLLCQLTGYDFQAGFDDPPRPDTVLSAIRYSLLTLSADTDDLPVRAQDRSLQIIAAPGIRREVEAVYQNILHHLETDPTLAMTDIAVMVSDMARYKPVVDAVFGQRPSQIRYNLVDARAASESAVAQAILALIPITKGDFSRKAVFDLLKNSCVMQKRRYTAEDLSVWIQWADALGIFHDFEIHDTKMDTEIEIPRSGRYSWKQGLERLRWSRIMTSPMDVPLGEPAPHFKGQVPFADIHTSDDGLVESFCAVVTELSRHAAAFHIPAAPAKRWKDLLLRMVAAFVEIPEDLPGEEAVYQTLVEALSAFETYDALMTEDSGRPLTLSAMWAFVRSHLDGISGGQGAYLTGGVTISAMMPMRPIPFKIVYVLGLEEGRFPAKPLNTSLDLRTRKRRIGDVSPADRDRYLFLEILISVRSRLYLSYISQDLQKDRELSPCQVVHQLRRYVEQAILGKNPFAVRHIPLRPDSPDYFSADAVTPWSDIMARTAEIHRLSGLWRRGMRSVFEKNATGAEKARLSRYAPDFSLPASSEPVSSDKTGPEGLLTLSIDLLYRFLLDPAKTVAARYLEIEDRPDLETRLAEDSDEPFSTPFPAAYHLRFLSLHRWLSHAATRNGQDISLEGLEHRFDALYADFCRRGQTPGSVFARRDRERLKTIVMETGSRAAPLALAFNQSVQRFARVEAGESDGGGNEMMSDLGNRLLLPAPAIHLPAVHLTGAEVETPSVPPKTVCLAGGLSWVWQDAGHVWHSLILSRAKTEQTPDKSVMAPILCLMALCAGKIETPWKNEREIRLHVVAPDGVRTYPVHLDPDAAMSYLAQRIRDVLTPFPLRWLPFGPILKESGLRKKIVADTVSDADREAFCRLLAEQTPDRIATLAGAVILNDSLDHARARFRIFFPASDSAKEG